MVSACISLICCFCQPGNVRVYSVNGEQAWVANILPQGEIQIPLEYTVEWPLDKEIAISDK